MHKLPKLFNSIMVYIQCHEVMGKYRLYEATKLSCSNKLISYQIKGAEFSVPWDQWCFWKNYGPENYYLEEIEPFTSVLNEQLVAFDFFDLGADVGVVSALVNKYCDKVNNIYCFEPNPTSFEVLQTNIANIDSAHKTYNMAVSDFVGQCHFTFNQSQGSDHEGHLITTEQGLTQVTTVDAVIDDAGLVIHDNVAIKIDVEGQELATLSGAQQLIQQAKRVVILLELHPDVLARDNQQPESLFSAAEDLRAFKWIVPVQANQEIDRTLPFFEQFKTQQYDVIGISL